MNYFLAVLAGAIQGLSEFLPVSSTGHLIIFQKLFRLPQDSFGLGFDASLHLGTLFAILIFFWKDYIKALKTKRLAIYLIVGTIPAAAAGLLLESAVETSFRQLWLVGTALIIFSFVIMLSEKIGKRTKNTTGINVKDSLIIGFFQSVALIPGVSRSGATISAGLFLNYKREDAARFAFMLSGPIIAAAGGKKFLDTLTANNASSSEISYSLIGIASSAFFGYLTIKYFLKYLSTNTLKPFVIYRLVLGVILIILSIFVF